MSKGTLCTITSLLLLFCWPVFLAVYVPQYSGQTEAILPILFASGLFPIVSVLLGALATFLLCKEKSLDTKKTIIAFVLFFLCFGPLVPVGIIFIPPQED